MGRKKLSVTKKIIRMLDKGQSPKDISERLGIPRQRVYAAKHTHNKRLGLGALGKVTPKPTNGVGTPPKKRKYVRKNVETSINVSVDPATLAKLVALQPRPSLWQRLTGWLRG
jgi:hypothetical protein